MTDTNAKDASPELPSERLSVKQLADKFKRFGTDLSGQTAVNKKAKLPLKDKPITNEKNISGNGLDSGSNILHTTETGTRPVSCDTPTENKEHGSLREDKCLHTEYELEHGSDIMDECMEKELGSLREDTCIHTEYELEHESDVMDECLEKTNSDVVRPEASLIDGMKLIEIAELLITLNMNAVTSIEESKAKLKQTLFSGQRVDSMSGKMKDVLNKTVQRYKRLKKNLLELYIDILTIVQNESFKENMGEVIEMRFPHYEEELQTTKKVLKNMTEEFEIVVSGETSSGKSTFLNVLLGETILPTHHLHTTASLCRLRNSEDRRIECFVENIIVDKIALTADSNELRGKLDLMTKTLLSHDGDHEPLKVIDLYWPVSSLHESVVLVDTPGIGERDALTRQVVQFVPKSAGYIFIVDSSHAGGVQDSGIRKLIEAVAVSASKEDHIKGLDNMIFVCNKWDKVPIQNRADVMENTKAKIRKYCGQLGDWQIITFDGNFELKLQEWKANPTDAFKTLLKSLETMMIRTIETRLRDKYRWIRTFVSELLGLIEVRMNVAERSKENVQNAMERARNELDLAAKELVKCTDIEVFIDNEEKSLLQNLEEYLKNEEVQRRHFDWTDCAPELSKLETDGPALIKARLQDAIFEWATSETGLLNEASVRITDICKELQSEIDLRINNLNHLDLGFSLINSSDQSDTWSDSSDNPRSNETEISRTGIASVAVSSPISKTVELIVLVVGLIPGLVRAIHKVANTKKKRIKKMPKMTKEIIDILVSENHLKTFKTDSFTGDYIKWLTKFKHDTVCAITSTRAWMLEMETDLDDKLQMFLSLQTKFNHCNNFLQKFENDI